MLCDREREREAGRKDSPLHRTQEQELHKIALHAMLMYEATVVRPHSKIARAPRINIVLCSMSCTVAVVLFINETASPKKRDEYGMLDVLTTSNFDFCHISVL